MQWIQYLGMWVTWQGHVKSLAVEDFTGRRGMQKMKKTSAPGHSNSFEKQRKVELEIKTVIKSLWVVSRVAFLAVGSKHIWHSLHTQQARTKQKIFFQMYFQSISKCCWAGMVCAGRFFQNVLFWVSICACTQWIELCLALEMRQGLAEQLPQRHRCSVPCSHLSVQWQGCKEADRPCGLSSSTLYTYSFSGWLAHSLFALSFWLPIL